MYKVKNSKVHGKGIYATQNIKKGIKIIEYLGEKISRKEGDRRSELRIKKYLNSKNIGSVYIFQLNNKQDIDGSPLYNKARYINHSCDPNCEVNIEDGKIWISSLRRIKERSYHMIMATLLIKKTIKITLANVIQKIALVI